MCERGQFPLIGQTCDHNASIAHSRSEWRRDGWYDANVYLHSTPAPQLFSQSRRDFSHGCVRVEDPVALAEWALKSENGWTRARIIAAMDGPRPLQVNLTRPIQVILSYVTAAVMPDSGSIHFA